MNFLITGSTGFIGRALCAELIQRGQYLRVAVRTREVTINGAEIKHIDPIDGNLDWTDMFQETDVVIHLAAHVHVMHNETANPLDEFLKVNFHGTSNLARQAAAAGVKRFVYISSAKVNGEYTDAQAFTESNQPDPHDSYGISKWLAEQTLHKICHETDMEVVIVRPPLVYGPGVKANFYSLMKLVNKALPLPLSSICNKRSMLYVGNLIDALILCATHPVAAGQTYLVSDGEDVSTPQLVQKLAHALHKPNRIFSVPVVFMRGVAKLFGRSAAIDRLTQSLMIDSSKIRKDLGWQPPYTMAQGLQATAEWYLQLIRSRKA